MATVESIPIKQTILTVQSVINIDEFSFIFIDGYCRKIYLLNKLRSRYKLWFIIENFIFLIETKTPVTKSPSLNEHQAISGVMGVAERRVHASWCCQGCVFEAEFTKSHVAISFFVISFFK